MLRILAKKDKFRTLKMKVCFLPVQSVLLLPLPVFSYKRNHHSPDEEKVGQVQILIPGTPNYNIYSHSCLEMKKIIFCHLETDRRHTLAFVLLRNLQKLPEFNHLSKNV